MTPILSVKVGVNVDVKVGVNYLVSRTRQLSRLLAVSRTRQLAKLLTVSKTRQLAKLLTVSKTRQQGGLNLDSGWTSWTTLYDKISLELEN